MTTQFDAVRGTLTAGGTGNVTLSSTAAVKGESPSVIPVGWSGGMRFDDPDGVKWELSKCTMLAGLILSRDIVVRGSSGPGVKVNLAVGSTALQTALAEDLNGQTVAAFMAANPVGSVAGTDMLLSGAGGVPANLLATFALTKYPTGTVATVRITAAGTYPLDSVTHHRRKIFVEVPGVTIKGPTQYATVGDNFECEIWNVSSGVVTLGAGITVMPSGTTIAVGAGCPVASSGGVIYARLGSGGAVVPDTVKPTATAAAVASATPTYVDITLSEAMDTSFTPAASTVTVSGHTVSALAYLNAVTLRATVTAFGNGEAARTVAYTQSGTNNARDLAGNLLDNFSGLAITNNVAAVPGGAAPFTVSAQSGFPLTSPSYNAGNYLYTGVAATGGVTASSVTFFLSTSNTVRPASDIGSGTTPRGKTMTTAGGPSYYTFDYATGYNDASGTNYYFWVRIVDSGGNTWWFVRSTPIFISDASAKTATTANEAMVQA